MIYFIQDGENGPIKIGYSDDVAGRIKELSTSTHNDLRVLLVISGEYEQETQLHKRFSLAHKKREWFWPVKELVEFIDGYKLSVTETIAETPAHLIPPEPLDELRICELKDQGVSLRNICLEIFGKRPNGWQEGRVSEILRKSGRSGHARRRLDEEKICQMYDEGVSLRGICWEIFGKSGGGKYAQRIKEILKTHGRARHGWRDC